MNGFYKQGTLLKRVAVNLINQSLSNPSIEVIAQTSDLFVSALELYNQRQDQAWSHTDCASSQIMQQQDIL